MLVCPKKEHRHHALENEGENEEQWVDTVPCLFWSKGLLTLLFIIANLDNGKVVHLVVRPSDAPHNPQNGK